MSGKLKPREIVFICDLWSLSNILERFYLVIVERMRDPATFLKQCLSSRLHSSIQFSFFLRRYFRAQNRRVMMTQEGRLLAQADV
jgi:hypothetical protein